MKQVEEISKCTEERDDDAQGGVGGHTAGAADVREEEVEWVDEESKEARDEEHVVPLGYDLAVWVEDLAGTEEGGDGDGGGEEVVAVGLVAEEAVAELRGRPADYSIHILVPSKPANKPNEPKE